MTREEILQSIEDVAREHLVSGEAGELERRLEGGRLTSDLRLVEDLALDSIQLLTLAVEVENRFRVVLDPEDEEGIETVGDLAAVVAAKLGDEAGDRDGA